MLVITTSTGTVSCTALLVLISAFNPSLIVAAEALLHRAVHRKIIITKDTASFLYFFNVFPPFVFYSFLLYRQEVFFNSNKKKEKYEIYTIGKAITFCTRCVHNRFYNRLFMMLSTAKTVSFSHGKKHIFIQ